MDVSRDDLPVRIDKPWGHEIWWAWTDDYVGKILHVKAGHRLSVQYHERKDETSYVLRGPPDALQGLVGRRPADHAGRARRAVAQPAGEIHTIEAIEDADVLEVSTPHLDDVVRLTDSYGREGTSAP